MTRRDERGRFTSDFRRKDERLYGIWCAMKERCYNSHNKSYVRYGGRGIIVCDEWKNDYLSFRSWANSNGYDEGLTIDRIENNGNYEPSNCRWVSTKIQNRNYSRNHNITYKGKTQCIADWAEETGVNRATILFRLNSGKPLEEVFSNTDMRRKNA